MKKIILLKSCMTLIFLLGYGMPLFAQNPRVVTGSVIDLENQEPIPGVTILEKGTTNGTVTDMEGNYRIEVASETSVLVFTFIQMGTQEIPVGTRNVINVSMEENLDELDEFVVIGYQSVRKRDLTGATAVVSTENTRSVTANSIGESLQGLAPGVTVRNAGGPGQGASVEIRGVSSFINASPLYVIDGMIADANVTINPNDVESIQILKDASAAAIYGSRAANGVIIVTTKQGQEGPTKVSLSAKYGVQQLPRGPEMMNNVEFASMQRTQFQNSGLTPPASVTTNFDPNINTNWYDEATRLGNVQDYNVTISGGSKTSTYLVSGSYFKNKGELIGTDFERAAFRINSRSTKGRVTFGENIVLTNSVNNAPPFGNAFYDTYTHLPIIPVQGSRYITSSNPDGWGIGTPDAVTYANNPIALNAINTRRSNYAKIVGNAYLEVDIADWLTYRFNAGLEASFDHIKTLRKDGEWHFNQPAAPTTVQETRSTYTSVLLEHTLNFRKTLGLHDINGVVGYSQQQSKNEGTLAGRTDLQSFGGTYLTTIGSATGDPIADGFVNTDFMIVGYLGRLNYTYNDKYLLTFTGRYDSDSRFGADNRSRFFPSVAAGWRISDEPFFNSGFVTDLKLRGSYGELGIVTVGSWDYIGFLNSNPRAIFGPDQTPFVGATQARLANPGLGWERRKSQNYGFDASFFEGRIGVSAEYYNSLSEDVLVNLPVAFYLGNLGGDPAVNAASIRNRGLEIEATYRKYSGAFQWDVSANLTTIHNRVEDVGNFGEGIDYIQTGLTRTQVGRSIGEWYVLKTDGLFQSQEEISNHTGPGGQLIQPHARPGDVRFVDVNGDGQINQEDRTFVGSPWPTLQTGGQFNASFGQFTLNLQVMGVFGYSVLNGVRAQIDSYQNTNFRRDISPWSPNNTNTTDPRIGFAVGDPGLIDNARIESDRWLEDASYVRLRNVELGYKLLPQFNERLGIQNARFFISGQNLLTFTGYSGPDPDVVGSGILDRGFDQGNWPANRIYSIGFNCEF